MRINQGHMWSGIHRCDALRISTQRDYNEVATSRGALHLPEALGISFALRLLSKKTAKHTPIMLSLYFYQVANKRPKTSQCYCR